MTRFSILTYLLPPLLAACSSDSATGGSGGAQAAAQAGSGSGGMAVASGGAPVTGGSPTSGTAGRGTAGTGDLAGSGGTVGSGSGGAGGAAGSGAAGAGGTGGESSAVTVQRGSVLQTIDGFGLNTALSNPSVNWDTFFGTGTDGLGLSIVRVAMDSKGKLSGVLPPASYKAKVIASPWTAPPECKDNNNTQKGGHLLKSCYDSWSTTIADFAKAQGLYAMAAANEPDFASCGSSIGPPCNGDYDSMVFTAKEMVEWVKVLGPKLKALNPPVKFIAPEPSEWIHLWSNMSATGSTVSGHPNSSDPLKCGCFGNTVGTTGCASTCADGNGYDYGHWLAKDATAWPLIDILGTHEYDTQKAEAWPADVDGGKRSKSIWETEVSGVMYWPEQGASTDIKNGIAVAGWIHSALTVGEASAWLYWWYEASGDNEGLLIKGSSALTKRCYALGNYSKFVRPGYTRVGITGAIPADVLLSAYTGEDGTLVVVAINKGAAAASVPITIAGGAAAPTMMTPYVTSANDSLAAKASVAVSSGTFTAMLDTMTITTFVGK
jgi:glucuronoarabinoxylan endo-1,4-beta-xylanase